MPRSLLIALLVVAIAAIAVVFIVSRNQGAEGEPGDSDQEVYIDETGEAVESAGSSESAGETEPTSVDEGTSGVRSAGATQVDYKDDATTYAYARDGRALIFFHASWCPTCKAAQQDLDKNISSLPKDLIIIKTDYDTTKELQKKYGVTYQHTWVQVDENGNLLTKWTGGETPEIAKNLKAS